MDTPVSALPFVSVIIPTFQDSDALEQCLGTLQRQTYPSDRYEIIVVNNCPNFPLPPAIQSLPQVKCQEESKKGSYAARNRGIQVAKGSILAFTDADCLPALNWLESGVKGLSNPQQCSHLLAGCIEISTPQSSHCNAFELYELVRAFDQQQYVQRDHYGATANLFVYRAVFDQVGLFNEELQSGGDFEWGRRATNQGHILIYDSQTKIAHPARKSWKEIQGKTRRIMSGHYLLMQKKLYSPSRFILALVADLLFPYRSVPTILSTEKLDGTLSKVKAAWASILVGYMRAFYRLRLALVK